MTNPLPVAIRRIRADETEHVAALWRRSRIAAHPALAERVPHSAAEDLQHFRGAILRECEVWVAERDGIVAGFAGLAGDLVGYLYVDPPAQRRGIGTVLLDHAKARSPSGLRLFTYEANQGARAFYARHGFRVVRSGVSPPPESEPDVELAWTPPRG